MTQQIVQVGDVARIRHAIRLATARDLGTLPPRAVEALWTAQRRFSGVPAHRLGEIPGVARVNAGTGQPLPPDARLRARQIAEFQAMQAIARDLLEHAAAGRPIQATMEGRVTIDGGQFRFQGTPLEAFRMQLAWHLESPAGQRVRKCPECGRFFLRVRRQIYCSSRCTDRATWRQYPEAKKRRARAKQYEKHGWTVGARTTKRSKKR